MNGKLKGLSIVALCGLLLGISPGTRLYSADGVSAGPSGSGRIESASVQFLLVHIERETLEELVGESNVLTLEAISLEKIGRYIHDEDGAEIVSQTKLTVLDGHEAEMTVVENNRRKAKNADKGKGEQNQRETEIFVRIKAKILDRNTLAADFAYKRSVTEEGFTMGDEAEEEEGVEQKFEIASGIILQAGQAGIAGANLTEDTAMLLIMKADLL